MMPLCVKWLFWSVVGAVGWPVPSIIGRPAQTTRTEARCTHRQAH